MRRWLVWSTAIVVAIAIALTVRTVRKDHRDKARIAGNQQALRTYSQTFRPGISRNQVQDLLRKKETNFFERCCYEERSAFAVLVQVGEEDAPWYCSSWPDFVVFEFTGTQQGALLKPSPEDVLKDIHLASNGEACL